MKALKFILLSFIIGLFAISNARATHIRAGEITAKRISTTSLTYRVTLTTYTDQINGVTANEGQNTVNFYFGVTGVPLYTVKRKKKTLINASTMCNVYDTTFTFPAPRLYTITCAITNRNANTVNLPGRTDEISFFVETSIFVNGSLGLNNTPVLLNIPIDTAGVGKKFIHNPGAFDADGDSLAYRLTTPKRDFGEGSGLGEFITGYRDPATLGTNLLSEDGSGPSSFKIDPLTGDLIWDAPGKWTTPQYQINVAFIIEEWRKGANGQYLKIGEITRDMQIIVVETPNKRPILNVPNQICVEAGQKVEFKVTATDGDNNNVRITTNSGVYNRDAAGVTASFVAPLAANFIPFNLIQRSPAEGNFTWETNCKHVRGQAYDVLFKVEDFPGRFAVQLTDTKTIKIKVIPPRPRGLTAQNTERGVELRWQRYPDCSITNAEMIVYRKEGCSNYIPAQCEVGLPASLGFVEVARISVKDTFFLDTKTQNGKVYSYSLVASLAASDFVSIPSVPSNEACVGSELPQRAPVMTNVSIESTDATTGRINVKWTRPLGFDSTEYKGPYQYKLYRATGINGGTFQLVTSIPTKVNRAADTIFVDGGLNTLQNGYTYKVAFLYENDKVLAESQIASSVRLTANSDAQRVRLTWQANVPWSNDNRRHRIYRESRTSPGTFNIIAEVSVGAVNTYTYVDDGVDRFAGDGTSTIQMKVDTSYCYKVETVGAYIRLPQFGLLNNLSQVACGTPIDNTPPCPPVFSSEEINCQTLDRKAICEASNITNKFSWRTPPSAGSVVCRVDILKYNIYYARYADEQPKLLTTVPATETSFTHIKTLQEGFAGCYYITAVNRLNIESAPSNIICKDNCPIVELPNVLTPNGDGKNDTFTPMTCSAFIKTISIEIYNRYGVKVYESNGETLSWDGKTSNGTELPSGTYYYVSQVVIQRLDKTDEIPTTIKGWIELIK
ncbi:gliding motility-associated C-terminal domain-containing protein [Emticicia sp. W12TSBA100-4]|uniref:gliding motility-associated C-terminal domain-containing protein n=1 Tax=Emticicia sp. W12TSBA100-4 TaxID=3160965 RepID=UPI00330609DC